MSKFCLKYATRGRPELFQKTMKAWIDNLSGLHAVEFIISIDDDDWQMQQPLAKMAVLAQESDRVTIKYFTGPRTTKIDAINRDMQHADDFDILIVVSDDMVPKRHGYDDIISMDMQTRFPSGPGALHYNDGHANHQLCTLSIMNNVMYEHFGYIYNPEYHSLWCDNEFMDVCRGMDALPYIDNVIIEHQYKKHGDDETYKKSESQYDKDRRIYLYRKKRGFPK